MWWSTLERDGQVVSAVRACSVVSDSLWPHGLYLTRLLCLWDFPSKNTGTGCHFLLQRIFLAQGSNLHSLHWQVGSLPVHHLGSPNICCICLLLLFCLYSRKWTERCAAKELPDPGKPGLPPLGTVCCLLGTTWQRGTKGGPHCLRMGQSLISFMLWGPSWNQTGSKQKLSSHLPRASSPVLCSPLISCHASPESTPPINQLHKHPHLISPSGKSGLRLWTYSRYTFLARKKG